MKVFTKLIGAAVVCASLGSVQAATVDCPGAFTATLTRLVTVTGALTGGECHYIDGNIQGDNVANFPTWTGALPDLIEKDVSGNGVNSNNVGLLFFTANADDPARTQGTWEMGSNLWTTYNEIFIAFHFGGGQGTPDSFIIELDPVDRSAATSGNWSFNKAVGDTSQLNGLSNIYLYGRGRPNANGGGGGTNGNGNNVPEPATLALVGLGLLGAAAARRRRV